MVLSGHAVFKGISRSILARSVGFEKGSFMGMGVLFSGRFGGLQYYYADKSGNCKSFNGEL